MARAKGDGTISWDEKRGCWFVRVTYQDSETGETKRKKIKGAEENTPKGKSVSLKIGQKWLEREMEKAMLPRAEKVIFGEWIDTWLKEYIKPNVRVKSYDKYEGCLVQYVKPKLGKLTLSQIRESQLTALFNELLVSGGKKGIGLSSSTVRATRRYLSMCLEQAIKSDILLKNPVKQTRPIKLVKAEIQTLTEIQADSLTFAADMAAQEADQDYALRAAKAAEEVETGKYTQVAMFNIVYHSTYMAILLALGTGMRLGEIFGLSWDAVDVEKGIIYVKRALVTSRAGVNFEEPKTKASRRQIPLSADISIQLRKYKALQERRKNIIGDQWSTLNLVITGEFGGVFNTSNFTTRYFKPLLKKIGVPASFKFHDLRHTHATLLLLKGIPVKVVSERLGHSTVAMTQDTYAHVLPEMQAEVVKVLDGVFTKKVNAK